MDGGVPITTYVSVAIVATALISAIWQIRKTGYFQRCCNGQKDPFENTVDNTTTNVAGTTTIPVIQPTVRAFPSSVPAPSPSSPPPPPSITKTQTFQYQNEKTKNEINKTVPRPPPMPAKTILPKTKTHEQQSGFKKSKPIKFSRW